MTVTGFFLSFVLAALGFWILAPELQGQLPTLGTRARQKEIQRVSHLLQELEECLSGGIVPSAERWEALQKLPAPWGTLAYESVRELRSTGGALLPTLKRLRALAEHQIRVLAEARSRAAQALAQATVCGLLVPVMGTIFYELIPGLDTFPWLWGGACAAALIWSLVGSFWLLRLADGARWAGLKHAERSWVLAAQCAGERFLSILRSGNPADIAWGRASELLSGEAPGLAIAWGNSVWTSAPVKAFGSAEASRALIETGDHLKKAVQVSLMEGRPCAERVEAALDSLRHRLRTCVERELQLLPARALQPLFACVAPSILGLLGFGFYLCWRNV